MHSAVKIAGVGVDLISWKRIERFLAEHSSEDLKRVLTPSEQAEFQKAPSSRTQFFARSFTAKEAYFKALEGRGMGTETFHEMEARMEGEDRFRISMLDSRGTLPGEGSFFSTPDGLGARVFIWEKEVKKS